MLTEDLAIYQGDDYAATITVNNADGTLADLTGYSALAQIRKKPADSSPIVVEFQATIQTPNILLALTHDQTLLLSGSYVWDVQITSPGGVVTTIAGGKAKATQEVTRVEARAKAA